MNNPMKYLIGYKYAIEFFYEKKPFLSMIY